MKNKKTIFKIRKALLLGLGLFSLCLVFNIKLVGAVTAPTPTPDTAKVSPIVSEAENQKISSEIDQLKDKIASRVSELNLVEKKGVIGVVTDSGSNSIMITDVLGNQDQIDVDEITKFSSPSNSSFGLSDVTKGTRISVLGLYNKQTKRILARFISTSVDPLFITGEISALDNKNFTFMIQTSNNKTSNIDIQTPTQISSYSKSDGTTAKIGFSKLNVGDRVFIVGFPDKKDATLTVASRVIVMSDAPKDPAIKLTVPSPTAAPTTAIKITPTVRKLAPTTSK